MPDNDKPEPNDTEEDAPVEDVRLGRDDRVSLHPMDPAEALRKLLRPNNREDEQ